MHKPRPERLEVLAPGAWRPSRSSANWAPPPSVWESVSHHCYIVPRGCFSTRRVVAGLLRLAFARLNRFPLKSQLIGERPNITIPLSA